MTQWPIKISHHLFFKHIPIPGNLNMAHEISLKDFPWDLPIYRPFRSAGAPWEVLPENLRWCETQALGDGHGWWIDGEIHTGDETDLN
jgi:hypothetical protein